MRKATLALSGWPLLLCETMATLLRERADVFVLRKQKIIATFATRKNQNDKNESSS